MMHVCRTWRGVLIFTRGLRTNINCSIPLQAMEFLCRSGEQLDVFHSPKVGQGMTEPLFHAIHCDAYHLLSFKVVSGCLLLEWLLGEFAEWAPKLKHLVIDIDNNATGGDLPLHKPMFEGRLPKLTNLGLRYLRSNLRGFNFPSLTRFHFTTGTITPVCDLTSFFERSPLLELTNIRLSYSPKSPTVPPKKRVRLPALRELELHWTACTAGLFDDLILPQCEELILRGQFTGKNLDHMVALLHKSSILY